MAVYNEQKLNLEKASELITIAQMPERYERELHKTGSHEYALKQLYDNAPSKYENNVSLVRSNNTTCVIVFDEEKNELTFAFDPTLDKGTVFNNADKWDNFNRGKTDHTLGGQVHSGLYSDLVDYNPDLASGNLAETINAVIYDHAYRGNTELKVNFTGFSKGGAQAALAVAEVAASEVFTLNDHIKLNDVISFAPPGYGTEEFANSFNDLANELDASVWTIELHGDAVPTVLTQDGANYFTKYDYTQFGNRAYITQNEQETSVAINPSHEELLKLRQQDQPETPSHRSDSYKNAINNALSNDKDLDAPPPALKANSLVFGQ